MTKRALVIKESPYCYAIYDIENQGRGEHLCKCFTRDDVNNWISENGYEPLVWEEDDV